MTISYNTHNNIELLDIFNDMKNSSLYLLALEFFNLLRSNVGYPNMGQGCGEDAGKPVAMSATPTHEHLTSSLSIYLTASLNYLSRLFLALIPP